MFAFWKGGATEQVRDGFIKNKLAIQRSDCKLKRRKTFAVEADALARLPDIQMSFLSGDPPEIYPKGHKLRISAAYEKNPLRPLGEPDFLCFRYTIDEHVTAADFCNLFFRLVFTRNLIGRFNQIGHNLIELRGVF